MSSLVRASIWLTAAELVFNLSGYVTHTILGRFFGPADYGRYGLVITFSTMVVVLIGRGVPVAMSKYLSEVRKKDPGTILSVKKTGAIVQTILVVFVTVAYYSLSPVFAKLLNDESLTPLFRASSLVIPAFSLASFYIYYFNGIHLFNYQSLIKFYRGIAKILIIVSAGIYFGVSGAIIGHSIAPFSVFALAFFLDPYRKFKAAKIPYINWRKLLRFAWPITVFMIFYELMISTDLLLVKALLGDDHATGIYNAALTVGRIPFFAFYFLTIILLPKISESTANNDFAKTKRMLGSSMRFLFMLLIPSITFLSLFSESAISFFFGAKFLPAAQSLSLLSFGLGFLTVFYILAFVLNGAGKTKVPMILSISGSILNFFLAVVFIKMFGLIGAASAITATSVFLTGLIIYYTNKNVASFFSLSKVSLYGGTSAVLYLAGSLLLWQGKFIFIFWSFLMFGLYFTILFLFKEFGKQDWLLLKSAFKRN